MKKIILVAVSMLFSLNVQALGPLTNLDEKEGDKLLTETQKTEYARLLDEGVVFFEKGDFAKAEQNFLDILKFAPKKPMAYYNLGLVKYEQGNFPEAVKNFDQVIKMRSYYTGAAFYYKAIAQYNMGQKDEALKTARRVTESRYFFQPSQTLVQAIRKDSDTYFEMATTAYTSQNYELCLLAMKDSLIADSPKGKEIQTKCREALAPTQSSSNLATSQDAPQAARAYRLFVNGRLVLSDNVTQADANADQKTSYYAGFGGEYFFAGKVNVGIGASYEHYNVIDMAGSKNETLNVYVPISYADEKNQIDGQIFFNTTKENSNDGTSDLGLSFSYMRSIESYLLGFSANVQEKKSLRTANDYKAGQYNGVHVNVLKFINQLTLGLNLGVDQNKAGDVALGTSSLPTANTNTNYSLSAAYSFNIESKVSAKYTQQSIDFTKVYSTNGTDRKDSLSVISLTYLHFFNPQVNAYLQQNFSSNTSNYDASELVNKNYKENTTTLGVSYYY